MDEIGQVQRRVLHFSVRIYSLTNPVMVVGEQLRKDSEYQTTSWHSILQTCLIVGEFMDQVMAKNYAAGAGKRKPYLCGCISCESFLQGS